METKNLQMLSSFSRFLERAKIHSFDINSFNSRVKLQKYVYIAKELFGIRLNYDFNLYLRGPYSTALARDYYELGNYRSRSYRSSLNRWRNNLYRFKDFVEGKETRELEILATTHFILKNNRHLIKTTFTEDEMEELVVEKVSDLKGINKKDARKVYKELTAN